MKINRGMEQELGLKLNHEVTCLIPLLPRHSIKSNFGSILQTIDCDFSASSYLE